MAVIDHYRNILTVLIEFNVKEEEIDALLEKIKIFLDGTVKNSPGFISANLHINPERTKIVNYAQWKSLDAYEAFLESDEAKAGAKDILAYHPKVTYLKVVVAT